MNKQHLYNKYTGNGAPTWQITNKKELAVGI